MNISLWFPGLEAIIGAILLWIASRWIETRRSNQQNDAGLEAVYAKEVNNLLTQLKASATENNNAAREARKDADESRHLLSQAQEAVSQAQKAVMELQAQVVQRNKENLALQQKYETFRDSAQEQITNLSKEVKKLAESNAGMIGGAIGLTPTKQKRAIVSGKNQEETNR